MTKFTFELDDPAEIELYKIVKYYKQFDENLSTDFILEFDRVVLRLQNHPQAGSPYLHGTKRVILKRFPYAVVYKIYQEKEIVAHAIMHMRRKPDYWKERL